MFSDLVTTGVNLNAKWFFDVVQATIDAGTFQDTNFFLTSDHGQMDIVRSVNINVLLADHGLITVNDDGSLKDWQAYCHSTGMSAQIKLKDPNDKEIWKKTYDLLNFLKSEGVYGVGDVFTAEEVKERDHLAGDFSFVIETDGYTSFSENWKRPLIKTLDFSDSPSAPTSNRASSSNAATRLTKLPPMRNCSAAKCPGRTANRLMISFSTHCHRT